MRTSSPLGTIEDFVDVDDAVTTRGATMPSRRRGNDPRLQQDSDLKHMYRYIQDSGYYSPPGPRFPETERESPSSRKRNVRKRVPSTKSKIVESDSDNELVVIDRRLSVENKGEYRRYRSPERDQEKMLRPNDSEDIFSAFARGPESRRKLQPTKLQKMLRTSQQENVRTNLSASDPRQISPFRPRSDVKTPASSQRLQTLPSLQDQQTSISPREVMLDDYDIDGSNNTPLFPNPIQSFYQQGKSSLTNPQISLSQGSTVSMPQQDPFVSRQSQQSRHSTSSRTVEEPRRYTETSPYDIVSYDHGRGILLEDTEEHKLAADPLDAWGGIRAGLSTVNRDNETSGRHVDLEPYFVRPKKAPGIQIKNAHGQYITSGEVSTASAKGAAPTPGQERDMPGGFGSFGGMPGGFSLSGGMPGSPGGGGPTFHFSTGPDGAGGKRPGNAEDVFAQFVKGVGSEEAELARTEAKKAATPPVSTLPLKPSSRRRYKVKQPGKNTVIEIPYSQPRSIRTSKRGLPVREQTRTEMTPPTAYTDYLKQLPPQYPKVYHSRDSSPTNIDDVSGFSRSSLTDPRNGHLEIKGIWAPYTISEDRTGNSETVSHLMLAALCRKEYSLAHFQEPQNPDGEESRPTRPTSPKPRINLYSSHEDPPKPWINLHTPDEDDLTEDSAEEFLKRPRYQNRWLPAPPDRRDM